VQFGWMAASGSVSTLFNTVQVAASCISILLIEKAAGPPNHRTPPLPHTRTHPCAADPHPPQELIQKGGHTLWQLGRDGGLKLAGASPPVAPQPKVRRAWGV